MTWLQAINQYWGIILFMAGLIFHALWTYFKVGEHGDKISILEANEKTTNSVVTDIKEKISSIDAKLDILLDGYHKNN